MRKVTLKIEEKLEFRHTIPVAVPDTMSEDEFENILNKVEREVDGLSDFIYLLQKHNINPIGIVDNDLDSPDNQEIECTEYIWEGD